MFFYSPSRRGFYCRPIHGDDVPEDAVPVTVARHRRLMLEQSAGAEIVPGIGGAPTARRRPDGLEDRRRAAMSAVNREARRRILAVAPAWRQANDNAAIAMAALQLNANLSTNIDLGPALERRRAIDALRAGSDRLAAAIAVMSRDELARLEVSADAHWSLEGGLTDG